MIQSKNLQLSAFSLARVTSAAAGLCAALLGCSDDSINMGEGIPVVQEPAVPPTGRCAESPILEGDVTVSNQEELDELEGCEVIEGNLSVYAFEGGNLRALHALTSVSGRIILGDTPEYTGPYPAGDQSSEDWPPEYVEYLTGQADYQRLQESWLSSLEGLEALESARSLTIIGLTAESLQPLGSLSTLTEGWLTLGHTQNLRNLDGLQSLRGVSLLSINAAKKLQSLEGLTLPEYVASMDLTDVDLRQQQPLPLKSIGGLFIEDTDLHDLKLFSKLEYADSVQIVANQKMESLAGLEQLQSLSFLDLDYNRYLLEIPDFEQLYGLRSLRITGSPKLARMPAFPVLELPPRYQPNQEDLILQRPEVIELEDLGTLTTISLPASWTSVGVVLIRNNQNLRQVDFNGQTYIDYLSVMNNPLLEQVSVGALDKVNVLEVVDNPRLSMSAFDSVRRLDTTASGNAAAPAAE